MTIIVHHLENSRSQRVLWLLEELGVSYEIQRYERDAKSMLAPPELLRVHPLGKSPVITDDDIVVAESGAIVEYLTARCGGALVPAPGTEAHRRYTYWLHYAEGSAMPPLLLKLVFSRLAPGSPALVRPLARGIAKAVTIAAALARTAEAKGAAFEGGVTVTGFDVRDGRVHGVRTDRGNVECERVLLCAGIWGPTVGAMAGAPPSP